MTNSYSEEDIKLANKLLSENDYIPSLHKFVRQTNMPYKYADTLLKMVQRGELK